MLLHELVGAGGFAEVFRATWRPKAGGGSVRTVAVKQLRDLPHQPAPLRAFCSEISIMQGFAHPNVLGLLGVCAGADGSLRMARHATAAPRTAHRRRTPPHRRRRRPTTAAAISVATSNAPPRTSTPTCPPQPTCPAQPSCPPSPTCACR